MRGAPAIVVVGAGFSGVAVAVQLLQVLRGPATVCLIGDAASFGRGLAYGTTLGGHLLNVPAGRMVLSARADHSFVGYLAERGEAFGAADFVPRRLYGDFLAHCLLEAQRKAGPGLVLEMLQGAVVYIEPAGAHGPGRVLLADGRAVEASHVVLANGHVGSRRPQSSSEASSGVLAAQDGGAGGAVLVLGSGLTAIDAATDLMRQGNTGRIVMLSRRGQLSKPHRHHEAGHVPATVEPDFATGETSLRGLLRLVRRRIRQAEEAPGGDWRDVVGGLREHTPRLWSQLPLAARRQFMRHLRVYWEAHRHRVAPALADDVTRAMQAGRLQVQAGRLLHVALLPTGGIEAWVRPRHGSVVQHLRFDRMIDCTGPCSDLARADDRLTDSLVDAGQIRFDAMRFGFDTDAHYRLIDRAGQPHRRFYYIGPHLRSTYLEATAVPELRAHAEQLALVISADVSGRME